VRPQGEGIDSDHRFHLHHVGETPNLLHRGRAVARVVTRLGVIDLKWRDELRCISAIEQPCERSFGTSRSGHRSHSHSAEEGDEEYERHVTRPTTTQRRPESVSAHSEGGRPHAPVSFTQKRPTRTPRENSSTTNLGQVSQRPVRVTRLLSEAFLWWLHHHLVGG
jgi:hypothetical protein